MMDSLKIIVGAHFTKTGSHQEVTFDKCVTFLHIQPTYQYAITSLFLTVYASKKMTVTIFQVTTS